MAKLGLKEAAKLVGKDKSTLTRAVQSGRIVNVGKDIIGNRLFDKKELLEVYGTPCNPDENASTNDPDTDEGPR